MAKRNWYYLDEGKGHGPFTADKIRDFARSGVIEAQTRVWSEGFAKFTPLEEVPIFQEAQSSSPEPPPLPSTPPPLPARRDEAPRRLGPIQKQEDEATANWMARASATLLVLMCIGSAYVLLSDGSDSISNDIAARSQIVVEEKWPAVFDPANRSRLSDPEAPSLTAALLEDMIFAFGFKIGQRNGVLRVGRKFPDLKVRLMRAHLKFRRHFHPAYANMDSILSAELAQWPMRKQEIKTNVQDRLSQATYNYEQALNLVSVLEDRAKGDLPSPVLETLLMFHPKYIRRPERLFFDGYVREYRTDGSGKARGIELAIQYPASWKAEKGRRPHVVQKFISENGHGLEMVLIVIKKIPQSISAAEYFQIGSDKISAALASGMSKAMANVEFLNSGEVRIAGAPTIWGEFRGTVNRAGITFDEHLLTFMMLHRGRLVMVMYLASPDTFEHYAGLFRLMTNSIDFFGRYEQGATS